VEFSKFGRCVAASAFALGLVVGLVTGPAGTGWADTPVPCGAQDDKDFLWTTVKDATPQAAGDNVKVVWPNNLKAQGYAIKNGQKGGHIRDFLLVPTVRLKGIECPDLLYGTAPEYFLDAYNELPKLPSALFPKDTDWALSIESVVSRKRQQLHIHLTGLATQARRDIDAALAQKLVARDEAKWSSSTFPVMGHAFRGWNTDKMTHSFFTNLNNNVVKKIQNIGMGDQTMLITTDGHKGFIVLDSDHLSTEYVPTKGPKIYGTSTSDPLLYR
jgi:CDP-diacylglycerol pyrophosphatase